MKIIFLAFILSLVCGVLYAQAPAGAVADSTPAKCRWNLTNSIYDTFYVQDSQSYARSHMPSTFFDVAYAGDSTNNCHPASSCTSSDSSALMYDVYYPGYSYDSLKLPCVILLHAGGFSECSTLQLPEIQKICEEFALRGFIVFNVEYRRGSIKDPIGNYESVQAALAQYRAYQDARGAIRSIIKRQRKHNLFTQDHYQIDTTQIFVGGMSAGAVAALNAAWYTDSMVYAIFPIPAGGTTFIQDALGPINSDFYYGEPAIDYKKGIIGAVSMWGGFRVPFSYVTVNNAAGFFANAHRTAFIAFHGKKDETIPYDTIVKPQKIFLSPPTHYSSYTQSTCVSAAYTVDGDLTTAKLLVGSGYNMYSIWNSLNDTLLKELYTDCQMRHGLDKDCNTCNFHSDFGTGLTTIETVGLYMVQRAATFFQAVMNNKKIADIGPPSRFTECENTRAKCSGPPNPHCQNSDQCSTD